MKYTNTYTGEILDLKPYRGPRRRVYRSKPSTRIERFLAKESGRAFAVGFVCFLLGTSV